jgi:hypothetical protein
MVRASAFILFMREIGSLAICARSPEDPTLLNLAEVLVCLNVQESNPCFCLGTCLTMM